MNMTQVRKDFTFINRVRREKNLPPLSWQAYLANRAKGGRR